jgi:hypothetical protein
MLVILSSRSGLNVLDLIVRGPALGISNPVSCPRSEAPPADPVRLLILEPGRWALRSPGSRSGRPELRPRRLRPAISDGAAGAESGRRRSPDPPPGAGGRRGRPRSAYPSAHPGA